MLAPLFKKLFSYASQSTLALFLLFVLACLAPISESYCGVSLPQSACCVQSHACSGNGCTGNLATSCSDDAVPVIVDRVTLPIVAPRLSLVYTIPNLPPSNKLSRRPTSSSQSVWLVEQASIKLQC